MSQSQIRKVDPQTARQWLDDGQAVLIDIREGDEYVREHIPEAHLVPLSGFSPEDFPKDRDKIAIFHCASGTRTATAVSQILASGFAEVCILDGGLKAWRAAGLRVNENRSAPISIMRQVQMVAGSLIMLGIALAVTVSPWFMALSAFVGAGLFFAGASGTCAMASLLAYMPWNKVATVQQQPPAHAGA